MKGVCKDAKQSELYELQNRTQTELYYRWSGEKNKSAELHFTSYA